MLLPGRRPIFARHPREGGDPVIAGVRVDHGRRGVLGPPPRAQLRTRRGRHLLLRARLTAPAPPW